jgi:phytoene desaturase
MADYDVIVIGAGCGGLSAGAQLARQGRRVLVLEQSGRVGGCCSTFEKQGFHFDVGASLIEDAPLINLAFERLGTRVWDEVDLIPCDPIYTVVLKDGTHVRYPASVRASADEIRRLAPGDADRWYDFVGYMEDFADSASCLFTSPTVTLADMARIFARSPKLARFGPLFISSYQDVLKRFFRDDRVRESLAYQTFFVGLPPELAPGLFAIIPYGEHNGLYYSKGGMIAIPVALQRCGERFGMEVRLNTLVRRVLVRGGRAIGVVLADGTEITTSVVVSNVNARTLYLNMIGQEYLPWLARVGIKSYQYAFSIPMLYVGVDYTPPLGSHHTLVTIPMEEMNRYWWSEYRQGRFDPQKQFGIISWTTHSDPALAPPGHHVLAFILTPAPYHYPWDEAKPALTEQLIDYFTRYVPGLAHHVRVAELSTPLDFERRLLVPEGTIYAFRQDITNQTVFRPAARSKSIRGLYLTGASTHPGGGVPTTIASGVIAADLVERYE